MIHIVVIPSVIKVLLHVLLLVLALLLEMGLNHFVGQLLNLRLDEEELAVWLAFFRDTLSGEVLDHILSEGVYMVIVFIVVVLGQLALIGIFPLSTVLVVSHEAMETSFKTTKVFAHFLHLELIKLNKRLVPRTLDSVQRVLLISIVEVVLLPVVIDLNSYGSCC